MSPSQGLTPRPCSGEQLPVPWNLASYATHSCQHPPSRRPPTQGSASSARLWLPMAGTGNAGLPCSAH